MNSKDGKKLEKMTINKNKNKIIILLLTCGALLGTNCYKVKLSPS